MKRVRTPCSARSGSSRSIVSPKISMRSATSSTGRVQFSVEKAYTASERMPRSIAASTVRRTARVPSRCPSETGSPRPSAQRALPSRMIATLRATSGGSRSPVTSDLHDLGLFVLHQVVDRLDVVVGELLHLLLRAPLLVVADLAVAD